MTILEQMVTFLGQVTADKETMTILEEVVTFLGSWERLRLIAEQSVII
jgi:hypothetical protein